MELRSDCDCDNRYHPDKANMVADSLSKKERVKMEKVHAESVTIQSDLKNQILTFQKEATKEENLPMERLRGLENHLWTKDDGGLYLVTEFGCQYLVT